MRDRRHFRLNKYIMTKFGEAIAPLQVVAGYSGCQSPGGDHHGGVADQTPTSRSAYCR